ncbi:MAG: TIGR00645 family protein [Alphaproteobacteria bacterium]|nr:TIGR00645 family protein [Alphaproteobacteria bacterium]
MAEPQPPAAKRKAAFERALETWIFRSRWLLAPFYLGLILALGGLLVVFGAEVVHEISAIAGMGAQDAIVMALSFIDLSLTANLLLIVIFSGYENFVSKIDTGEHEDRPDWMGAIDFADLKMKLIASIIAISAIALLRSFMKLSEGDGPNDRTLAWMVGLHLTFLASGLFLALMELISSRSRER